MPKIDLELFSCCVARDLLREFFTAAWGRYSKHYPASFSNLSQYTLFLINLHNKVNTSVDILVRVNNA